MIILQLQSSFMTHYFQLVLGNIDSVRDWGHAIDYVEVL